MYSKDFQFFLENQIAVMETNDGKFVKFFSRLNGKLFLTIDGNKRLSYEEIREECKKIHEGLKYYD